MICFVDCARWHRDDAGVHVRRHCLQSRNCNISSCFCFFIYWWTVVWVDWLFMSQ